MTAPHCRICDEPVELTITFTAGVSLGACLEHAHAVLAAAVLMLEEDAAQASPLGAPPAGGRVSVPCAD